MIPVSLPDPEPIDPRPPPFETPGARHREPVWDIVAVIAAGGALGGAARHAMNVALPAPDSAFPWSTFAENVSGSFLLGALMVYLAEVWPPNRYLRPFLGVGILGGFTTFSAYTSQTRELLIDGQAPTAWLYLFGSTALGLLAVWAGIAAATAMIGSRMRP